MASDATTFFLSFLAVFAGLAAYLWHLDRMARRLEARVATLERGLGQGEAARPAPQSPSPATDKAPRP